MGSKQVCFLLTVVILVFDCGNCNMQQFKVANSIRVEDSASLLHRDSRSAHRHRRSVLNSTEMQIALDVHNRLRRSEGASNMELLIWDTGLANTAEISAERCIWNHTNTGQNLYTSNSQADINLTAAIVAWYSEKPWYADYVATNICRAPEQQCLHYPQVVWSTSRRLGCAYYRCPFLHIANYTNATLLVCNYDPPGNVVGESPYKSGRMCSTCDTGKLWCNDGLCDESCTAMGPTCVCSPICQNNGSVNSGSCSCSCAYGWTGPDCGEPCKDKDSQCNPSPGQEGYPPAYCNRDDYGPRIKKLCPKMCNICQGSSTSMKPSLLNMLWVWLSWLLIYSLRSI